MKILYCTIPFLVLASIHSVQAGMSWNQNGNRKYAVKFVAAGFIVGYTAIWSLFIIKSVILPPETKTEGMIKFNYDKKLRIRNLLFSGDESEVISSKLIKSQTTNAPLISTNYSTSHHGNTTENPVLKELHDIKNTMLEFEGRMKKLVEWENYRHHHEKLKKLVYISDGKADKKYGMFRPNVLVDKIKFDSSAHYKVIILVTSFAKHFERRQWIRKA
uniref:Cnidarian restricted protein n=2 Tax=Clytia hemisphaerica TaxID=252671 RepID=A0A7M5UZH1_9CNID